MSVLLISLQSRHPASRNPGAPAHAYGLRILQNTAFLYISTLSRDNLC